MSEIPVNSKNILSVDVFKSNIGKRVQKTTLKEGVSPRPFKSGFKINTVKDVIIHPVLNIPAYIFEEDDSYVECRRCLAL